MKKKKIIPSRRKATSAEVVSALTIHKGDQSAAARSLGMTPQAVQARIKKDPVVRSGWERYTAALEKTVPHKKSIRVIAEGMEAVKEHRNMSGEVVDRSPDHLTRLKANEQYLKVSGLIKDEKTVTENKTQVNVYSFNDVKTEDLVRSIDEIISERLRRKSFEAQGTIPSV